MARYRGPTCKLARRLGTDLQLKSGIRALDSKCKLATPPGMHGVKRGRLSEFGVLFRQKQLIRMRTSASTALSRNAASYWPSPRLRSQDPTCPTHRPRNDDRRDWEGCPASFALPLHPLRGVSRQFPYAPSDDDKARRFQGLRSRQAFELPSM